MSMTVGRAGVSPTPQVWSGASMQQSPTTRIGNLFDQIDTSGSGTITKAQFETAFASLNPPKGIKALGADAVWAKLDPSGSGKVTKQAFVDGMKAIKHARHAGTSAAVPSDSETAAQTAAESLRGLEAIDAKGQTLGANIDTLA